MRVGSPIAYINEINMLAMLEYYRGENLTIQEAKNMGIQLDYRIPYYSHSPGRYTWNVCSQNFKTNFMNN